MLEQAAAYSVHCTRNIVVPLALSFVEAMDAMVTKLEAYAETRNDRSIG